MWLDDLTMLKLRYLTVYCHLHDGNIKTKATLYLMLNLSIYTYVRKDVLKICNEIKSSFRCPNNFQNTPETSIYPSCAFVNNRIHTLTLHYFIYIVTNHTSINDLGQNVTSIGAILFYSD